MLLPDTVRYGQEEKFYVILRGIYIFFPTKLIDRNTLQARRSRDRVPTRSLDFSIDLIQPHFGPVVDSASNRIEYQESSWG
jgi:hypothetical protein